MSPSIRPRSSSNLPTLLYSEPDRHFTNHTSFHTPPPSSHLKSRSFVDVTMREGGPSTSPYHPAPTHTSSNGLGLYAPSDMHPRRSMDSRMGTSHSSRNSLELGDMYARRASDSHVIAGSSTMDRSAQEAPMPASSTAKYECSYCGKGFNRPSSLKVSSK